MTTVLKNTLPLFAQAVGSPVLSLVYTPSFSLPLQEKNEIAGSINNHLMARHPWLTCVILATQEAEIRIVCQTLS
jgi:hypothetical protein